MKDKDETLQRKGMTVAEFFEELKNFDDTLFAIDITNKFKKSLKLSYSRNLNLEILQKVVHTLAKGETLAKKYRPHQLGGNLSNIMECHILPDWLLLWQQYDESLVLLLIDLGTHSDLFGKHRKYLK